MEGRCEERLGRAYVRAVASYAHPPVAAALRRRAVCPQRRRGGARVHVVTRLAPAAAAVLRSRPGGSRGDRAPGHRDRGFAVRRLGRRRRVVGACGFPEQRRARCRRMALRCRARSRRRRRALRSTSTGFASSRAAAAIRPATCSLARVARQSRGRTQRRAAPRRPRHDGLVDRHALRRLRHASRSGVCRHRRSRHWILGADSCVSKSSTQ